MNNEIEFHDSTIREISSNVDGSILIHFDPAYVHKSLGEPSIDPGTGWLQRVHCVISSATIVGKPPALPSRVWGGTIDMSGPDQVSLTLEFNSGEKIVVSGKTYKVEFIGEAKYVEDVDFSD